MIINKMYYRITTRQPLTHNGFETKGIITFNTEDMAVDYVRRLTDEDADNSTVEIVNETIISLRANDWRSQ